MRISRSTAVGLFGMLVGGGAFAAACDGFNDVDSSNSTYCSAVTYLKDKGITLGCTGTSYCPNDYVTRLQMALFLQRVGRGGPNNVLGGWTDTISGGDNNSAGVSAGVAFSVVAGGANNIASGLYSVVGGGSLNQSTALHATISGGFDNRATGSYSTAEGGAHNVASGFDSTTLGGSSNWADGDQSIVLGSGGVATAAASGSFVFSDATTRTDNARFGAGAPNLFVVGASGGIDMFTNKDYSTGCTIGAGGGTWSCSSSKDVKRDFSDVDTQDVLERVAALPVQRWRYKNEALQIRHMGTFAQDFHDAFGLGADPTAITMADADGVALASIQALRARLKDKDAEIASLSRRLETLERLITH